MHNFWIISLYLSIISISFISGTTSSPSFVGYHDFHTTVRPIPLLPDCRLPEKFAVSRPIYLSLWRYDETSRHKAYLVSRDEIKMKCHMSFFGSKEKTLESSQTLLWEGEDKFGKQELQMITELRARTFQTPEPTVDCNYFFDTTSSTIVYTIKEINVEYDPTSGTIAHPVGFKNFSSLGVSIRDSRHEILVMQKVNDTFSLCDIKKIKEAPAIVLLQKDNIHPINVPLWKEMFYWDEQKVLDCPKTSKDKIYATRGGFIISFSWVTPGAPVEIKPPENHPLVPVIPTRTTTKSPTGGINSLSILPLNKRMKRGLNAIQIVQEKSQSQSPDDNNLSLPYPETSPSPAVFQSTQESSTEENQESTTSSQVPQAPLFRTNQQLLLEELDLQTSSTPYQFKPRSITTRSITTQFKATIPDYLIPYQNITSCPLKTVLEIGFLDNISCPAFIVSEMLYSPPSRSGRNPVNYKFPSNVFYVDLNARPDTIILPQDVSSRSKRSIHEHLVIVPNMQHELGRSELQWGLYHLANLTESSLLTVAQDICNLKYNLVDQVRTQILEKRPIDISSVREIYSDDSIREVYYRNGEFDLLHGTKVLVKLIEPLNCCGFSCLVSTTDNHNSWLNSISMVLESINKTCDPPSSSLVFSTNEHLYIDVRHNVYLNSPISIYDPHVIKPLEFSFDSSSLYDWDILYPSHEHLIVTNSSGVFVTHTEHKWGTDLSWAETTWDWFTTGWHKLLLNILMMILMLFTGWQLLLYIWRFKIKTKRDQKDEEAMELH